MRMSGDNDRCDKESRRRSMIMNGTTMAFGGSMIVANDNGDRKMIMAIVKTNISMSSSRQWLMMTRKVFRAELWLVDERVNTELYLR